MKSNQRKKKVRRISLCWLLAVSMMLTGVSVQAAAFGAPGETEPGDFFSSGEINDGYVEQNTVLFEAEAPAAEPVTATPAPGNTDVTVTPTPGNTDSQVTPTPGGTTEQLTPTPSVTPDVTPSVTPSVTPGEVTPTPGGGGIHHLGDPVRILFADTTGTLYYDNLEIQTKIGESVILPKVPGTENNIGCGWKLEKETSDEDAILLEEGESVSLALGDDLLDYVVDGILVFYAVPGKTQYTVSFYNNSGTGIFSGGQYKVDKGTEITIPDFPSSKYVNFGWTDVKGGTTVRYHSGDKYTVNSNLNFYIIRYSTSKVARVSFANPGGSQNAAFRSLTQNIVKGKTVKLPAVPEATGYVNLGWSTKKNATTAAYAAGKTVTVKKNVTFYAVRKKVATYSITFNNNSGTSTSKVYSSLNKKVTSGSTIVLPALPKAAGYQNLGWTTTLKGSAPLYKVGGKFKITKNMKFYTVRRKSKYYTVYFYLGNGTSNSEYKALQMKVEEGTTITLPDVPVREGYKNSGWSTKKNAASAAYLNGDKVKITKNTVFYAVQNEQASVVLHYNNGALYLTEACVKGGSYTLPGVRNKAGYTMMGWSTKPYQTVNAEFEVGETITVNEKTDLYAVVFNRDTEKDISAYEVSQPDLRKYKQVIFVGDSRTNRMNKTLQNQFGSGTTQGVTFISREGGGLTWLQSEGYLALTAALGNSSGSILEKPTAVIFNLGVNDLGNLSKYITYMNNLANELKTKGCKLFYMSVNPVNNKMIEASGKPSRKEQNLRSFNAGIRANLCSNGTFTYIDTYSYLMQTGFGTCASPLGDDAGYPDDGLHYTTKTYKRIYDYCLRAIAR